MPVGTYFSHPVVTAVINFTKQSIADRLNYITGFEIQEIRRWNNIMSSFISSFNMTSPLPSPKERVIELRVYEVLFKIIGH